MNICIIGNCHTIGLHAAWQDGLAKEYPDAFVTFFFHGGGWFGKLNVDHENRTLKIEKEKVRRKFLKVSGGDVDIDLRKFDAVLIVGGFFHWPIAQISALRRGAKSKYSGQVVMATVRDLFLETQACNLLSKIREVSDVPVYMMHNPFRAPSESVRIEDLSAPFETYDYVRGVKLLNEIMLLPAGAEMLPQPSKTILAPYYTKRAFAVGWRKPLRVEIKAGFDGEIIDDLTHTNASYGELRMKQFLERLGVSAD